MTEYAEEPGAAEALEPGYDELAADGDEFYDDEPYSAAAEWMPEPAAYADPQQQGPVTAEDLEDLAIENPLAAIDYLATQRAAETVALHNAQQQQILAPILQQHNQAQAAESIQRLQQKFGPEAFEAAKQALADRVANDEDFFLDPATRDERLEMILSAALYAQHRAYDSGADIADSVSATQSGRDLFGAINVPLTQPEHGETQPAYERRLASAQRAKQQAPTHPDPEVAAMDAVGRRRDIFG